MDEREASILSRSKKNQPGFSLIEIVIVIVIVGILAAIALTNYVPLHESAKRATCLANQRSLEEAQTLFYSKEATEHGNGRYADTIDELTPFMRTDTFPVCPDGFEYRLLPEGKVECASPGHRRD